MHNFYFLMEEGYVIVKASDAIEAYALYKAIYRNVEFKMFNKYCWRTMVDSSKLKCIERIEVKR